MIRSAAGLARNTTAPTTSSGSPTRPRGIRFSRSSRIAGSSNVDCVSGKYAGTWNLALNEEPGTYVLRVRDVATGMSGEKEIEVVKGEG